MDLKQQILVALGLNKDEELQLAWQSKSEDGTIFVSTAEELEAGVDISVLTEDGTTILLPIGTYKTQDGVSFRVEVEGVVAEVIESETEEKEEAKKEDDYEEDKEEKEEMGEDRGEDDDEAAVDDWQGMEKRIKNLEDAVADLKKQIGENGDVEEMTEETVEPSKNPKTITTKEVVEFSVEEVEAIKAENEKLKTELAESPAEAPINTNKFSSEKTELTKKQYNKLSRQQRFLYNLNK
jgi:regulator of replication initiation timing